MPDGMIHDIAMASTVIGFVRGGSLYFISTTSPHLGTDAIGWWKTDHPLRSHRAHALDRAGMGLVGIVVPGADNRFPSCF